MYFFLKFEFEINLVPSKIPNYLFITSYLRKTRWFLSFTSHTEKEKFHRIMFKKSRFHIFRVHSLKYKKSRICSSLYFNRAFKATSYKEYHEFNGVDKYSVNICPNYWNLVKVGLLAWPVKAQLFQEGLLDESIIHCINLPLLCL